MTDLKVDDGDHLDMPECFSGFSNRILGDRWKFGLPVLKEFLDLSYGDLSRILPSMRGVLEAGGASRIPHKDTLRKFSGRLPEDLLDKVIGKTARLLCGSDAIAAADSTGFSESNASKHFVKRLKYLGMEDQVVRDFAKATFVADMKSLAIISCYVIDSHQADVKWFTPALETAGRTGVKISKVLADNGYDAQYT